MSTIYVTVPGRVATAPERLTSGKSAGAKFRVVSTERRFDRASEAWNDAAPVYITVTCWRQLAESVLVSLRTGDPVLVHGKVVRCRFERDGRAEERLEVVADAIGPDLRWSTAVVTRTRAAGADAPGGGGTESSAVGRVGDIANADRGARSSVLAGEGGAGR
jgi:single-strand DNA-binding protein